MQQDLGTNLQAMIRSLVRCAAVSGHRTASPLVRGLQDTQRDKWGRKVLLLANFMSRQIGDGAAVRAARYMCHSLSGLVLE